MRDEEINVSEKHIKLRTIAFILVLILAVSAFSYAIASIGRKEPGYYSIETEPDEDAPLYASGVNYRVYFEGKSDAIKQKLRETKEAYSTVLKRAYKLLDGETEYEGFQNIATLNKHTGEAVNVNAELYAVLQDAYAKTLENAGYNMFAGALYREWHSILILDEPEDFDPVCNPDEAERIEKITAMVNDLSNFTLEFLDDEKFTVKFSVSDKFLKFAEEMELGDAIMDLNELHDAYELMIVTADLERNGFTDGYFTTDSGLTVSMPENEAELYIYGAPRTGLVQLGTMPMQGASVCSLMKAVPFADGEAYYYTLEAEKELFRHPYFSVKTGGFSDLLLTSCVLPKTGTAADACYFNLRLMAAETPEELRTLTDTEEFELVYTLQGERTVYASAGDFVPSADSGYTKKPVK